MTNTASAAISMAVPDGNQWIEYMVNTGTPTSRQLGVLNHLALGTLDIEGVHQRSIAILASWRGIWSMRLWLSGPRPSAALRR